MKELQVFNHKGKPVADSREIAEMIGRPHYNLMKQIRVYCDHLVKGNFPCNDFFIPSTYKDTIGRKMPCYYLTRLGCDLVANKMTGEKGTLFTAAYVTRFNEMEYVQMEKQTQLWHDTRQQGKQIRRYETECIKELVEYAKKQGSKNANRYYTNLSKLANSIVGITDRNNATLIQLQNLSLVESLLAEVIQAGIKENKPYKAIFGDCKALAKRYAPIFKLSYAPLINKISA